MWGQHKAVFQWLSSSFPCQNTTMLLRCLLRANKGVTKVSSVSWRLVVAQNINEVAPIVEVTNPVRSQQLSEAPMGAGVRVSSL